MSVKLIVVALLAATAVAADATAKKTVKTTMCADGAEKANTCECAEPTVKEYATMCPNTAGTDKIFWKADSCDDSTADFVVKGYSKEGCAEETRKVPKACTALYYYKAECTGTKDDNGSVKLYIGCNSAACNAGEATCTTAPLTFKLGDKTAAACQKIGDGTYYKLKGDTCPTNGESVNFEQYTTEGCTASEKKDITASTTCTASHYQKSECTAGADGKVNVTTCSDNGCTKDCIPTVIPLKKYTKVGDAETVYIESCTADESEYTFQVYAGVKQYSKTCAAVTGGHAMATCVTETTTTETVNETTNETTTTEGSGIIAPAHTAGVLALVLCLLACVY